MKKILKIVQTTLIGGLFFLVPLVLLSIIVVRAYAAIQKLIEPLLKPFANVGKVGMILQEVIGVVLLLVICLMAGLFSRTKAAKRMIASLERGVLQYIPGYMLLKNMAENTAGIDSHDELKVVLIRTDAGWQLGFIVDKVNESLYVVFAPDAPNTMSGSVVFVEIEHMRLIDITQKEARQCIRKLGLGSGKLFRDKLPVL
jgi:uncharacterized membrane protein